MTRRFKRWLCLAAGWSFIALGVLGLILPFLQGVLFLLIGITILSAEYVWARKLLQKLRDRFPSLIGRLDAAKKRAGEWLRRIAATGNDSTRH
ncbi:MAG TPA: PGPGW domain-containing protein [Terriglobia bacterium]|nr:PGPGW domain-containing protein [Terriglobia bacterium]